MHPFYNLDIITKYLTSIKTGEDIPFATLYTCQVVIAIKIIVSSYGGGRRKRGTSNSVDLQVG